MKHLLRCHRPADQPLEALIDRFRADPTCKEVFDLLSDYVDGDLSPALREALAQHLGQLKARGALKDLVLDLRQCVNGSAEEAAAVAGLLGVKGPFGTLQEAGKADRAVAVAGTGAPFSRLALLVGRSTLGLPEVLAACLKKGGARAFGDLRASLLHFHWIEAVTLPTPSSAIRDEASDLEKGGWR